MTTAMAIERMALMMRLIAMAKLGGDDVSARVVGVRAQNESYSQGMGGKCALTDKARCIANRVMLDRARFGCVDGRNLAVRHRVTSVLCHCDTPHLAVSECANSLDLSAI